MSKVVNNTTINGVSQNGSLQQNGGPAGRFLSKQECIDLAKRIAGYADGGGRTMSSISSSWSGNVRWARNQIFSSGDVRNNNIYITRVIRGAGGGAGTNQLSATRLESAVRRAERLMLQSAESLESSFEDKYLEPYKEPKLWYDSTYALQADERAEAMRELVKPAEAAGMLSAGYISVAAYGQAVMDTQEQTWYYPYTTAQYSVTVRDPAGTGSGWAGVNWNDWTRIGAEKLSAIALDKCLRSRNPVAVEPGRYTTILEPQAVFSLVSPIMGALDRRSTENWKRGYRKTFSAQEEGYSKIGETIIDDRLTFSVDYMHPDLGFPPFDTSGRVYNPVEWIKNGVLMELAYDRNPYGIQVLNRNYGLPNNGAFMMSGGTTTVDEMISNTKRGILVTRLSGVDVLDELSLLCSGVTRDGTWLIENGKISKPIKNLRFTDSPLFALNNVLELGRPQRVFSGRPTVVPPLKIQDFSFTSLSDAV